MVKNSSRRKWGIFLVCLLFLFAVQSCNLPRESQPEDVENQTAGNNVLFVTPDNTYLEPVQVSLPTPKLGDTMDWYDAGLLVYVPAGESIMGSEEGDTLEHIVDLDGYWIYKTEVTNRMYLRCIELGFCTPAAEHPSIPQISSPQNADLPVVGVTWEQAVDYCESVGGDLPTEAQWEKAARGTDGALYPWGDEAPICDLLNFNNCMGGTSSVLGYPDGASPYGLLDMAGNVFEWTADWYLDSYYTESIMENPHGPEYGTFKAVRGSAFETTPDLIALSIRNHFLPSHFQNNLGFRCVVENPQSYAPSCEMLPEDNITIVDNPNDAPGGSASCVVPQPAISIVTYCEDNQRGFNFSWTPVTTEFNFTVQAGNAWCSQYDQDTMTCVGETGAEVDFEVCSICPPPVVELGVFGTCDPPYVLDLTDGLCKYGGPPVPESVSCPPGYSLSGDSSCCEFASKIPLDYLVCPVGGRFDNVSGICWFTLPSTGDQKCASESVYFTRCESDRPSGGGQDPCSQYTDINDCGMHPDACHWDYAQNACVSN